MGLTDKLKGLQQQAQATVAEHRGGIHSAVESVSNAANQRTRGKYADKIAKAGRKVTNAVDRIGTDGPQEPGAAAASAPVDPASAGAAAGGPTPAGPGTVPPEGTESAQAHTPPRDFA